MIEHLDTRAMAHAYIERATYDSVAFRFIAANDHPDHDTVATFRRRCLTEIERLFVKVVVSAREMGMLHLGTVALDGTQIHANASRHRALSYERAGQIEAQLKVEVIDLLARAEAADHADVPDGLSIPDELAWREECLRQIAQAREAKVTATGKKPGGPPHWVESTRCWQTPVGHGNSSTVRLAWRQMQ